MTRNELNDLHESLCYGHDAEIIIGDAKYFIEWNTATLDVFKVCNEVGEKVASFSGNDMFKAVELLFAFSIDDKTLNDDFSDIQIVDIE